MNPHAWLLKWVLGIRTQDSQILVLAQQVQLSYLPRLLTLKNKNLYKISLSSPKVLYPWLGPHLLVRATEDKWSPSTSLHKDWSSVASHASKESC